MFYGTKIFDGRIKADGSHEGTAEDVSGSVSKGLFSKNLT